MVTDANGEATVELPDYFEALNGDFRYQLTVIGKAALATIETEIENNTFMIRTDQPNVKVSWLVMGTRHDPAILANRLPVEEEKPAAERGFVAYPGALGADRRFRRQSARLQEVASTAAARTGASCSCS